MYLIATIATIVLFSGFQAGVFQQHIHTVITMVNYQLLEPDRLEIDVESELGFDNSNLAQDYIYELDQMAMKDSFGSSR